MLFDGVGGDALADAVAEGLRATGRSPVRVRGRDFLRPAGERFEHGRENAQDFRSRWLDIGALRREVLEADGTWLPALWDAERDRSARAVRQPVPERAVLLVDGVFLLDPAPTSASSSALPAELVVHVALSPAALLRRGVPAWQVPAFTAYDAEARPGDRCDVLVRAEDPARPAVLTRRT